MYKRQRYNRSNLSSIASIDTLGARIKSDYSKIEELKLASLVIIDEAHNCTSESYARFIWWLEGENLDGFTMKKFYEKTDYKKKYLGFSATPFAIGKKTHRFFEAVINNISPAELRDQGFLVPARVFRPAKKVSRENLAINSKTGDYQNSKLFQRFGQREIVGDVVDMYRRHGNNGRAICFAINLEHSKMLAAQFCDAGIPAVHCDAGHTRRERDCAIAQLESATISVLCNVNIFSVGLDCPWLDVAICARPTASEVLAVQQWGRVLRPFKVCVDCGAKLGAETACFCGHTYFINEKTSAIILDHANNSGEFGLPFDDRIPALTEGHIQERKETPIKDCPKCHATMPRAATFCESCKTVFKKIKRDSQEIGHSAGELDEVTDKENQLQILRRKIWKDFNGLRRLEIIHNWQPAAKWYRMVDKYGRSLLLFAKELGIPGAWQLRIQKLKIPEQEKAKTISK